MMLRLSSAHSIVRSIPARLPRSVGERKMLATVREKSVGPVYTAMTGDFSGEFWPDLDLPLLFEKGHIVACPPNDWFKRMVRTLYKPSNPVAR